MPRNQNNWGQRQQPEQRVGNPFAPASVATTSNPFQQQQRIPSSFSNAKSNEMFSTGNPIQQADRGTSMMGDDVDQGSVSQQRVSNPFASFGPVSQPTHNLTLDEAVRSYRTEVRAKKGYPFSCLGQPDLAPVLKGDLSPAELRWYLSQGDTTIQRVIGERASLLNEDFSDFLKGAFGEGVTVNIQRVGPYRVPDASFPDFVPRSTFRVAGDGPSNNESSVQEWRQFTTQTPAAESGIRLPRVAPPLEFR